MELMYRTRTAVAADEKDDELPNVKENINLGSIKEQTKGQVQTLE